MNVNDSVEQKVPHNYSVYVLRSMLVLLILVCLFVFFSSLSFFQFLVLRAGHRETRPLPTVHAGLWHSVSDWHFYSVLLNLNNFSHTHTHGGFIFRCTLYGTDMCHTLSTKCCSLLFRISGGIQQFTAADSVQAVWLVDEVDCVVSDTSTVDWFH